MTRLKRKIFERSALALLGHTVRLQPRDVALLSKLASYRFLNTQQIAALQGGGLRNLRRRLSYLYHLGYVERPPQQTSSSLPTSHIVYALGEKGAEMLFEEAEERDERIRQIKQDAKTETPYISHALMISQFRAALTLALHKEKDAKIVRWKQGYELRDALKLRGENPPLVPDAFFTIEDKGDLLHFFLEADRATMTTERFLRKLKIYWRWWQEEKYKDTLRITRFRVLAITPSENWSENLRRAAKDADTRGQGSNMFLFASEKDYSLKNPEAALAPIWRSPKDGTRHSILE